MDSIEKLEAKRIAQVQIDNSSRLRVLNGINDEVSTDSLSKALEQGMATKANVRYQVEPTILTVTEKPQDVENTDHVKAAPKRPNTNDMDLQPLGIAPNPTSSPNALTKPAKPTNSTEPIDKKKLMLWAGVALVVVVVGIVAFKKLKK